MQSGDPSSEVARLVDESIQIIDHQPQVAAAHSPIVHRACEAVMRLLGSTVAGAAAMVEVRRLLQRPGGAEALAAALRNLAQTNPAAAVEVTRTADELRYLIQQHGIGSYVATGGGSADGATFVGGDFVGSIRTRTIKIGRLNLGLGNAIALVFAITLLITGSAAAVATVSDILIETPAEVVEKSLSLSA